VNTLRRLLPIAASRPFVFCEKLLGYFCKPLLNLVLAVLQVGGNLDGRDQSVQGVLHIVHLHGMADVYGRFGPKYEQFGAPRAICAILCNSLRAA
jgi:hypothetical protein